MDLREIEIKKPENMNFIFGQTHFIKSVEDLYETMMHVPGAKFGIAFCEASGPCLVRAEGNDSALRELAIENAMRIGAGHTFIIFMENCFPINVLNEIKRIPEVCRVFCATANPVKVLIAEGDIGGDKGRAAIGVIDGFKPKNVETEIDVNQRKEFLRKIGYKR